MEFIRVSMADGRRGKQLVRMPVVYDYSRCKTPNQKEQERRTKWRSLYHYVKAVFDAVDKGIVMVEQAFMADTVVSLPSGEQKRVIEAFLPQVSHGVLDVFALPPGANEKVIENDRR
jgi:Holliday junction resolvase RusA-like endonuclease